MLTQRTNLANLVTTIHSGHGGENGTSSLTESFQSYVTGGQTQWNAGVSASSVGTSKKATETSHKDAYEKEKLTSDSYSVQKEKVRDGVESLKKPSDVLSDEELEQLEKDIRDVLKESLDMTDEEIDEILATENLNIFSLLKPEQLQDFLMSATETEPLDLLTDSSLIDVFQQMSTEMEDLAKDFDISEAELNQLLNQESEWLDQTEIPVATDGSATQTDMVGEAVEEMDLPVVSHAQAEDTEVENNNGETSENGEQEKSFFSEGKSEGFTTTDSKTGVRVSVEGARKQEGQGQTQQGIASEIVNQLTQAVNELEEVPTSFSSDIRQSEIVQQVIEQIRVTSGSDMNQIEVQLYPQHLGRVQIQVMMKNGVMTAQIHAETEMAKEAIESQLQQLKETFQEKSIHVEAVEVSVGTSNFQREQERQDSAKNQQSSRSKGRRIRLDGFGMTTDDLASEETVVSERLEAQGASVEFSA